MGFIPDATAARFFARRRGCGLRDRDESRDGGSWVCAVDFLVVAVLVISSNFDGQHRKQCKWEGLEPGEASVSWLLLPKTALESANSGASRLETLQNYRLGGLLVKLHMEPCVRPSQRGSY
jgi:hypothetical protein